MTIYIVEDEVIFALSLREELAQYGYTDTHLFTSGEKALQQIKTLPPDLLVMDINLHGNLDGLETVQIIHKQRRVPVIFISGYSDSTVQEKARQFSPIKFFIKPIKVSDLHSIIQQELGSA
ncbi:response regulator [Marispirochaeta aestuarii]|uniref:response regulator n=1 Tax=Marispirochaeta aestuarii TaxID=1963862 RepID=UPI0029C6D980|nr:response regulator [Marispirochaeta aestuarii]